MHYAAPSGTPENVRNSSMTSDSITFVWDRIVCIERNGEITGYTVRLTRPGGDVVFENTTNVNFTATTKVSIFSCGIDSRVCVRTEPLYQYYILFRIN